MYQATLTTANDITAAYIERLDALPALTQGFARRLTIRVRSQMLKRLRTEPGRPDYPIQWTSEKQRRFVMAKLTRENNLPYQRTHATSQAWGVSVTFGRDGGVITLENALPHSIYVYGPRQQRFLSKWPEADTIALEGQERLENDLIEGWYTLADPQAGIPG